jgi:hypothetical protein
MLGFRFLLHHSSFLFVVVVFLFFVFVIIVLCFCIGSILCVLIVWFFYNI